MPDPSAVKVAAVRMRSVFVNKTATVEWACSYIAEGRCNGANVVFPEAFVPGCPEWVGTVPPAHKTLINELHRSLLTNLVAIPHDATAGLCEAAKEAGTYVAIGASERNTEVSNASV